MKQDILLKRHYILPTDEVVDKTKTAYYNAYLLSNFGIEITNSDRVTQNSVKQISNYFDLKVPKSFYDNPQHTKYFTKEELLIEQLVSYFVVETEGVKNENTNFNRIEIFKKNLPEYVQGDEIKTRKFTIIDNIEADKVLKNIAKSYCNFTRPFSMEEREEFEYLIDNGYYDNSKLECKDNIFMLVEKDISFSKFLDRKDIVKYSHEIFGEADFKLIKEDKIQKQKLEKIKEMISYAYKTPLSKKQAKEFNKLCKECGYKTKPETNEKSPYRLAKIELDKGNVLGATEVFAQNGSLLERNLKMLLSRANPNEMNMIVDKLSDKNPIALYQMVSSFENDVQNNPRTFKFTKNGRIRQHFETEYETKYRKSSLNPNTTSWLKEKIVKKIEKHYDSLEKIGKVYISPEFEKIALPTNTSATGKGLDVMPTGSRTELRGSSIRTFVYWNDIYDIDSSLALLDDNDKIVDRVYFGNAFNYKCLGIFFSGDNRSYKGSEYYDIEVDTLKNRGISKVLFVINGFQSNFSVGKIQAGYQDKNNLETEAWDPKNIEFKMNIKGDSHQFACFGIDLNTKEVITINQMCESSSNVIDRTQLKSFERLLKPSFLNVNMATVLKNRGELVSNPEEADVIFDTTYQAKENQIVIRPYEIEKLVDLINDGTIEKKNETSTEIQNNEIEIYDFDDIE